MDPLQARLNAAELEANQLRQEVTKLAAERDQFKKLYLVELARNSPDLTQADLEAAIPTGPWFNEFLSRLESGDADAMKVWPIH
jgi:hypothetical protein